MLYLLHKLYEPNSWKLVFNLFRYVTVRSAAAAATAFLVTVLFLPALIRRLKALQVVENTRHPDSEWLSERQRHKSGTPTMGGLGILAGLLGATLLWADLSNQYVLCAMLGTFALGCIGFIDDWMKLHGIGRNGMPMRWKLLAQTVVAAGVALFFIYGGTGPFSATRLAVPFIKPSIFAPELGLAYAAVVVFLVVGSSNAVNITDGLDGLAAGCTGVAALAYTVLAYVAGHAAFADYLHVPFVRGSHELVILCAALGGSILGFLWYNAEPAQIFMGDTGSLAIGGLIGIVACAAKQELLLAMVGGVFVMEAGSVILQVASFRLRGKRIFRIAPLHHHLQRIGWSDATILARFWIMAVIFALTSVATLKIR